VGEDRGSKEMDRCPLTIGASLTKPKDLWDHFCIHICDDLHYKLLQKGISDPSEENVYDYGLYLIQDLLGAQGSSLENFPPMPLSQIAVGKLPDHGAEKL
jgi:hypothetical protein